MPTSFTAGSPRADPRALPSGSCWRRSAPPGSGARGRWAVLGVAAILALAGTNRSAAFWGSAGQLAGALLVAALLIGVPLALAAAARRGRPGVALAGATARGGARRGGRGGLAAQRALPRPPLPHRRRPAALHRSSTSCRSTAGAAGSGTRASRPPGSSSTASTATTSPTTCSTWAGSAPTTASARSPTAAPGGPRSTRGDYDYVVAMPRFGGRRELQARWTQDPHARVLWHSAPITVFRLTGKLDPARCGTLPTL